MAGTAPAPTYSAIRAPGASRGPPPPAPARSRSPPAGGDAARRGGGRAPSWSRHRACAGAPIRPRRGAAVRRHGGAQGPANRCARPAGRGCTASVRRHPRRGRGDERRAVCAGAVPLRPVSPAAAGSATSAGATAGACCVTAIGRRRATTQRMRLPRRVASNGRSSFPPSGKRRTIAHPPPSGAPAPDMRPHGSVRDVRATHDRAAARRRTDGAKNA